jgi:hypothetical protein
VATGATTSCPTPRFPSRGALSKRSSPQRITPGPFSSIEISKLGRRSEFCLDRSPIRCAVSLNSTVGAAFACFSNSWARKSLHGSTGRWLHQPHDDPSPRPVGVRDAKSIYSIGNKATRGYAIQTVAATTPGNRFLGRIYPHVRKSERVYHQFHIDEVRSSWADIGKARPLRGYAPTHRLKPWHCQINAMV